MSVPLLKDNCKFRYNKSYYPPKQEWLCSGPTFPKTLRSLKFQTVCTNCHINWTKTICINRPGSIVLKRCLNIVLIMITYHETGGGSSTLLIYETHSSNKPNLIYIIIISTLGSYTLLWNNYITDTSITCVCKLNWYIFPAAPYVHKLTWCCVLASHPVKTQLKQFHVNQVYVAN